MASGRCDDAFVALVKCVAAAAKDGSGTPTTPTTQPLPCLDVADSLKKCMEENAGEYAHTLDLMASSGAGAEGEADADNASRGLVLEVMKVQAAAAKMELVCKDAFVALEECVTGWLAAGGMTATTLPFPCQEAADRLKKCMEEEHADFACSAASLPAGAGEGEADAGNGKVGVTACQPRRIHES